MSVVGVTLGLKFRVVSSCSNDKWYLGSKINFYILNLRRLSEYGPVFSDCNNRIGGELRDRFRGGNRSRPCFYRSMILTPAMGPPRRLDAPINQVL